MKKMNMAVLTVLLVFQTILSPLSVFAQQEQDIVANILENTEQQSIEVSPVSEPIVEENTEQSQITNTEPQAEPQVEPETPVLTTQFQLDFQKLVHNPDDSGKGVDILTPEEASKVSPKKGDRVNIYYSFTVKDEGIAKNEYFEFELPETLLIYDRAALSGQIRDSETNEHLFDYTLDKSSRIVRVTVAESIENGIAPGVRGGMSFMAQYGNFKGDSLNQSLKVKENNLVFNFTFEPQNGATKNISKKGKVGIAADGSRYIDWEVIYNDNGENLAPAVTFKDTIEAGHKLDPATSVQYAVADVQKTLDGVTVGQFGPAQNIETMTVSPETPSSSQSQSVEFEMATADKAVKVTYRTLITRTASEGTHEFKNKAEIQGAPKNAYNWSATGKASTKYDPELIKHDPTGDNYKLNWAIEFNKIGKSFQNGTVIIDELTGPHKYDLGTNFENVKVSKAIYQDGKWSDYSPLDKGKYEVAIDSTTGQLNIILNEGGTYAVKIEYPTTYEKSTQPLFAVDEETVVNDVFVNNPYAEGTNFSKQSKRKLGNGIGVKQFKNIDYANKKITWSIQFDTEGKEVGNFTITDTLVDYLDFDGDTVVTNCPANVNCEIQGKTLKISNKLVDNKVVKQSYKFNLEFVTSYSNFPTASAHQLTNSANFIFFDTNGVEYKFNKAVESPVNDLHARNADKTGFYNYKTQQFEWTATLNYDRKKLVSGTTITDVLNHENPGQTYVLNADGTPAISMFKGIVKTDGSVTQGAELVLSDYFTFTKNDQSTFTLTIKENVTFNDVFILKYKTKDDDKIIGSKNANYKNTVTLNIPGENPATDYEEVAIKYANEIITKEGKPQPEDMTIDWLVNVNRSGSNLSNVKVADTLSKGENVEHMLLQDTIRIKQVTFNEKGIVVNKQSKTIEEAKALGWIKDATMKLEKFELDFGDLVPDENGPKAFIVEYSSFYNGPQKGHYGNLATLTAKEVSEDVKNTSGQENKEFVLNASDAYANYERGNLQITKIGKNNMTGEEAALSGVTFELWNIKKGFKLRDAQTTNQNGIVTFNNLGFGKYMLKEVSGKEGYKHVEWHEITIGKTEDFEKVIYNEEIINAVQFEKMFDDASGKLNDVKFELYRKDIAGDIRVTQVTTATYLNGQRLLTTTLPNPNLTFTPDASGKITVSYLLPGDYYFKEVATTTGFKLADPIEFTVEANSVQLQSLGTVMNVKIPEPVTPEEETPPPAPPVTPEEETPPPAPPVTPEEETPPPAPPVTPEEETPPPAPPVTPEEETPPPAPTDSETTVSGQTPDKSANSEGEKITSETTKEEGAQSNSDKQSHNTLPQTNGEKSSLLALVGLFLIVMSTTILFKRRNTFQ